MNQNIEQDIEAEVLKKMAAKYAVNMVEKPNNAMAARDLEQYNNDEETGPNTMYDISKIEDRLAEIKNKLPEQGTFDKV
jgi:hypothetical protein